VFGYGYSHFYTFASFIRLDLTSMIDGSEKGKSAVADSTVMKAAITPALNWPI
jgi:hypothetical protein